MGLPETMVCRILMFVSHMKCAIHYIYDMLHAVYTTLHTLFLWASGALQNQVQIFSWHIPRSSSSSMRVSHGRGKLRQRQGNAVCSFRQKQTHEYFPETLVSIIQKIRVLTIFVLGPCRESVNGLQILPAVSHTRPQDSNSTWRHCTALNTSRRLRKSHRCCCAPLVLEEPGGRGDPWFRT